MKKNTAVLILGIMFGILLLPMAYINLVVGLALAFANNSWFALTCYVYIGLGIITIIGSAFARKQIIVCRIILSISNIIHLALIIYLFVVGLFVESFLFAIIYITVAIIGIIALILSFITKNRKNHQNSPIITPSS